MGISKLKIIRKTVVGLNHSAKNRINKTTFAIKNFWFCTNFLKSSVKYRFENSSLPNMILFLLLRITSLILIKVLKLNQAIAEAKN